MARPQYIGVSDAAFRLGQTARRTYDFLFSGKLRGCRHGNRWLCELASVQELERELKGDPMDDKAA